MSPANGVAALAPPPPGRQLRVMGILNVTPDSFSDGGRWAATDTAVAHGLQLRDSGADLVDIGGESTRPGAHRVPPEVELKRVIPVVRALAGAGVVCSVDTTRASVADAAIDAGASVINDVSGGLADPEMSRVMAASGLPWVLMHWRAPSVEMNDHASYENVVTEVRRELCRQIDAALAAGVDAGNILIDPGLGFAKRSGHNWTLLHELDIFVALGFPVLVGASRKRFLPPSGETPGSVADLAARDQATAVISSLVAMAGGWGVRVHEATSSARAAEVAHLIRTADPR